MSRPPSLLLTRPEAASRAFLDRLDLPPDGAETVIAPLFEIVPLDAPPLPGDAATLVFTSAAGVRAHLARGGRTDLPALAVGCATAEAARAGGIASEAIGPDADALVAAIVDRAPDGLIVHLHGAHRRGDVADRLNAAGLRATAIALYDQPARPPTRAARTLLAGERPVTVPLFSPRSAALFAGWPRRAPVLVAAMSEAVAKAAAPLHSPHLTVAARPDAAAMVDATRAMLATARKLEDGEPRV